MSYTVGNVYQDYKNKKLKKRQEEEAAASSAANKDNSAIAQSYADYKAQQSAADKLRYGYNADTGTANKSSSMSYSDYKNKYLEQTQSAVNQDLFKDKTARDMIQKAQEKGSQSRAAMTPYYQDLESQREYQANSTVSDDLTELMDTYSKANKKKNRKILGNDEQTDTDWESAKKALNDAGYSDEQIDLLDRYKSASKKVNSTWYKIKGADDETETEFNSTAEALKKSGISAEQIDELTGNTQTRRKNEWIDQKQSDIEKMEKDPELKATIKKYTDAWSFLTSASPDNKQDAVKEIRQAASDLKKKGLTDEEIQSLIDTQTRSNNYDSMQAEQEWIDKNTQTKAGKVGLSAGSVLASLGGAYSVVPGIQAAVQQKKTGEYTPIDTNSPYYALSEAQSRIRQNVSDDITDKYTGIGGKVASLAYNAGMSTADSALSAAMGGEAFTLANMGLSAAGQTTRSTFERTGDTYKSILSGAASGAIETLTEKVSLDHLWDIAKNGGKVGRKAVTEWLVQAGIEGSEEGASDIANLITDHMINGGMSEYQENVQAYIDQGMSEDEAKKQARGNFFTELAEDIVVGAMSGAMGGAGALVANRVTTTDRGKQIKEADLQDTLIEEGKKSSDPVVKKAAEKAENKPTDANIGELFEQIIQSEQLGTNNTDIETADLGNDTENAEKTTDIARMDDGRLDFTDNDTKKAYEDSVQEMEQAQDAAQLLAARDNVLEMIDGDTEMEAAVSQYYESLKKTMIESGTAAEEDFNVVQEEVSSEKTYAAAMSAMNSAQNAQDLETARRQAYQTAETEEQKASVDNTYARKSGQLLAEGKTTGEELTYEENKLDADQAYQAGYEAREVDSSIMSDESEKAYIEGVRARERSATRMNKNARSFNVTDNSGNTLQVKGFVSMGEDPVIATNNGNVKQSELGYETEAQRYLYAGAASMPTAHAANLYVDNYIPGMKVDSYHDYFTRIFNYGRSNMNYDKLTWIERAMAGRMPDFKEIYEEGKRVYEKEYKSRKVKKEKEKGKGTFSFENVDMYDTATEAMLQMIASRTGVDQSVVSEKTIKEITGKNAVGCFNAAVSKTFLRGDSALFFEKYFHENFGEYLEAFGTEDFETLQEDMIAWNMEQNQEWFQSEVEKYINLYEGQNVEISWRNAANEILNDQWSALFRKEGGIEDFVEWGIKNDQKAFTKALNTLKAVVNKIVEAIRKFLDTEHMTDAAKHAMEMDLKTAEDFRRRLLNCMDESIEQQTKTEEINPGTIVEDIISDNSGNIKSLLGGETYTEEDLEKAKDIEYSFQGNDRLADEAAGYNTILQGNDAQISNKLKTSAEKSTSKGIDQKVLDKAIELRAEIKESMEKYEKLMPIDIEGQVEVGNSSYGLSMENAMVCVRSIVNDAFTDLVAEELGRPLEVEESIMVSEVLATLTGDMRECAYCYVATDRKSYNASVLKYHKQYIDLLNKVRNNKEAYRKSLEIGFKQKYQVEEVVDGKKVKRTVNDLDENPLYKAFLKDGRTVRKSTEPMWERYTRIIEAGLQDRSPISLSDLASPKTREKAKARNEEASWFIDDALMYAQSASWAKKKNRTVKIGGKERVVDYVAYNGSILNWSQAVIDALNEEYGLRMYSFSDYTPAFLLENMQMVTDAAVRNLKMLSYTKDVNFAKVFAPTHMGINISVFGTYDDASGTVIEDNMQGAKWEETKQLREQYDNVGAVFVAGTDKETMWALKQDWIDVVIPFHLVRTGKQVAKAYGFKDHKAQQADKKEKGWKTNNDARVKQEKDRLMAAGMSEEEAKTTAEKTAWMASIPPTIHHNDLDTYKKALEDNHLEPRFKKYFNMIGGKLTAEEYMKLVNETRKPYNETAPVEPIFDEEAARAEVDRLGKEGYGVLPGLTKTRQQEIMEEMAPVAADDIRKGLRVKDGKVVDKDGRELSTSEYTMQSLESEEEAGTQDEDGRELSEEDDIRYALSDDELELFVQDDTKKSDIFSEPDYSDYGSIIETGQKIIDKGEINVTSCQKVAQKIIKEYGSAYGTKKLADDIKAVFAFAKTNKIKANDFVKMIKEIAEPVVEQSNTYDKDEIEQYDNFRKYVRSKKIRLSDTAKEEIANIYGGYNAFRKKFFGVLNLSDDGVELDSSWSEIVDNAKGYLEYDTNETMQPIALVSAIEAMKPAPVNVYAGNEDEVAMDVALEIMQEYFANENTQEAQKLRKEFVKERAEYRKRIKDNYDAALEKEKDRIRNKDKKVSERVLEAKMRMRNTEMAKAERQQKRDNISKIQRTSRELLKWIERPTNEKHVPEGLQKDVLKFLASIDFVSSRALDTSKSTERWQEMMTSVVNHLKIAEGEPTSDYDVFLQEIDPDFATAITNFTDKHNGVEKLSDLDAEELKELANITTMLKRAITRVNDLARNKSFAKVEQAAVKTMNELSERKDVKASSGVVEMAKNLLNVDMLDSMTLFKTLGTGAESMWRELRDGFDVRVNHIKEAQTYMEEARKDFTPAQMKKITGDGAEVNSFFNGKIKLTKAQMMELYVLAKRPQALQHITNGGVRIDDIGKGKTRVRQADPIKLTQMQIAAITSSLTEEERRLADKMQVFLAKNAAEWGNHASQEMYGYDKFKDKNYWPIRTDDNSNRTSDNNSMDTVSLYAIKNMGATKALVKEAKNAIRLQGIFDSFTDHVVQMASYDAYAAPLCDLMKWYNYKVEGMVGDEYESFALKRYIETKRGQKTKNYIIKLIKDINGEATRDDSSEISNKLISNYKGSAVGANLRVAIQQPTAIVRALMVVEPQDILKAIAGKPAIKKAQQNSAIAQWKSWGYYDTSMGQSMKQVITGVSNLSDQIRDKTSFLAAAGDEITWGYLWKAAENNVKRNNKGLTDEDMLKKTTEVFDRIIDETQVVDTLLHRSQFMRSQNALVKIEAAFQSEPHKSYNMLYREIEPWLTADKGEKKKYAGKATKAIVVYTLATGLTALAASLSDAVRDDDDDKEFGKKYLENVKENFVSNINPLGMIPYIKDVISMLEGYDSERIDTTGMANMVKSVQAIYKEINGSGTKSAYGLIKSTSRGISQITGIPIYNILRDVESNVELITGTSWTTEKKTNNELILEMAEALEEGDNKTFEKLKEKLIRRGVDEEDLTEEAVTKKLASKEKSDTTKALKDGEISEEEAQQAYEDQGMSEDDAFWKTVQASGEGKYDKFEKAVKNSKDLKDTVQYYKDHGVTQETLQKKITEYYKEDFIAAMESGDKTTAAEIKSKALNAYVACGADRDTRSKTIDQWVLQDIHNQYKSQDINNREAAALMQKIGMSSDEISATFHKWGSNKK